MCILQSLLNIQSFLAMAMPFVRYINYAYSYAYAYY